MGICLCLLFAIFPGYPFSCFLSCEECVAGVGSVAQRAPLSRGYNQLKLPETEAGWEEGREVCVGGVRGQKRNVCSKFTPPSLFSLPQFNFLCVPEMLERWMLPFVQRSLHVSRESLSILSRRVGCTTTQKLLNQGLFVEKAARNVL